MIGIIADPDKGATVLMEMIKVGGQFKQEVESRQIDFARLYETQEAGLRDKLNEWLKEALELAKEFGPQSYSVNISIPFVGSVGFSWTLPSKAE